VDNFYRPRVGHSPLTNRGRAFARPFHGVKSSAGQWTAKLRVSRARGTSPSAPRDKNRPLNAFRRRDKIHFLIFFPYMSFSTLSALSDFFTVYQRPDLHIFHMIDCSYRPSSWMLQLPNTKSSRPNRTVALRYSSYICRTAAAAIYQYYQTETDAHFILACEVDLAESTYSRSKINKKFSYRKQRSRVSIRGRPCKKLPHNLFDHRAKKWLLLLILCARMWEVPKNWGRDGDLTP